MSSLESALNGFVPPQDIKVERAILSAILSKADALLKVPFLRTEMFYKEAHLHIFEAITQLDKAKSPIDILTVANQLSTNSKLDQVGGRLFIMELLSEFSNSANIEYHGKIIQEKFISRELIISGHKIIADAYDETTDTLEVLINAEKSIKQISSDNISSTEASNKDLLKEIKKDMKVVARGGFVGHSTGLKDLDKLFTFEGGSLYMLAAKPSTGKSSLALSFVKTILDNKKHVVFNTLEMGEKQLLRWVLQIYGAKQRTVKYGTFIEDDKETAEKAFKEVSKLNIHITGNNKIDDIVMDARVRAKDGEIEMLVIDYIQKARGANSNKNKNNEISDIMDALKELAKELNIPILILSQLNRQVGKRPGNIPQMDDLRDSGSLEEGSDVIIFLHRAEMYDEEATYEINGDDIPCQDIMRVIVAKNKDGEPGDVYIKHSDGMKKFTDYAVSSFEAPFNDDITPNMDFQHETENTPF